MFDSVIFKKSLPGNAEVDIGLLAECLVFYNRVHIIANMSMLRNMVNKVGLDTLEYLINNKHISLSFSPALTATRTNAEFTHQETFDYGTVIKLSRGKKEPDYEDLFFEMLEKGSEKRGKSRRVGGRILDKIEFIDYEKIVPIEKGIPEIARRDLDNNEFTKSAIKLAINHFAPEYKLPQNWDFRVVRHDKGFNIFTNIDLAKLNDSRSKLYFPDPKSTLTRSILIDTILKANEDLFLSAHYDSEILTNPLNSAIIGLKLKSIIQKTSESANKIELFQNVVISNAKKIREVINSGEKNFNDIIPLLDSCKRFKDWLQEQEPDATLIREYYQAIIASSWIDKLPYKGLRFSILTGAGIVLDSLLTGGISTIICVALGIGDTFLLDKFMKGWKPNQYIDEIEKFLK